MATNLHKTRVKGTMNLVARSWTTTKGERRTRYYVRFRDWKGVDREIPAGDGLKAAKELRNEIMARNLHRFDFDQAATKDVTFADWCTRWLDLQRTKKSYSRLRDRTATPDEYQRIYELMPPHLRPILTLCRELGLRTNEAVLLRADQIDWTNRLLTLTSADTKTKRKRVLPMNDLVEHSLQGLEAGAGGRLFWHNGKPLTRYIVWWNFKKAAEQLGIRGLTVHDLRGTFATEKLAAGNDAELVRRLTGHSSAKAFDRYVRPRLDTLRKIVERPGPQTVH